jgi:histone H3/H4
MADILVVASKVKQYIKEKSQMNTSSSTLDALSEVVKKACDEAISKAQAEGRKTVMDRDVAPAPVAVN